MSRNARIVVPEVPHHVTQRGVRKTNIFRESVDYGRYTAFLSKTAKSMGLWSVHMSGCPTTFTLSAFHFSQTHSVKLSDVRIQCMPAGLTKNMDCLDTCGKTASFLVRLTNIISGQRCDTWNAILYVLGLLRVQRTIPGPVLRFTASANQTL
jgi:hypothetical protein